MNDLPNIDSLVLIHPADPDNLIWLGSTSRTTANGVTLHVVQRSPDTDHVIG